MPICRTWQTRSVTNGDYIRGVNVKNVGSTVRMFNFRLLCYADSNMSDVI
jgi:hypothetical protein